VRATFDGRNGKPTTRLLVKFSGKVAVSFKGLRYVRHARADGLLPRRCHPVSPGAPGRLTAAATAGKSSLQLFPLRVSKRTDVPSRRAISR
jgi:hypothetical protein